MTGSAPTPEAAWLAAREGLHIAGPEQIRRQLGPLPLSRLHLDSAQQTALERMGFRQVRDLLRLPRKALTRRFGPALPDYLDRVLGVRPDPRAMYQPPESFSSRLELPAEVHSSQGLLFPLKRLLEELCGVLRGGDNAVQSLQITLGHEDHDDSLLTLGLQSPTQDCRPPDDRIAGTPGALTPAPGGSRQSAWKRPHCSNSTPASTACFGTRRRNSNRTSSSWLNACRPAWARSR